MHHKSYFWNDTGAAALSLGIGMSVRKSYEFTRGRSRGKETNGLMRLSPPARRAVSAGSSVAFFAFAALCRHYRAIAGTLVCFSALLTPSSFDQGKNMLNDRENILGALREKPLKVYEIMKRANVVNEEACQSLLLKMRNEGLVKFDIHKGLWLIG